MQYYGLILDLIMLGLDRANDIAGPSEDPNTFLNFKSTEGETWHPVRLYCWYVDKVYIVYWFTEDEAWELI